MAPPDDHDLPMLDETRMFGATGVDVSVIGQGTWKLRNEAAAQRALERGLELGLTHIDTAELYTGSEATIAPVIADPKVRERVFLVSKVLPRHGSLDGTMQACADSMERLGVTALDAYLLHWNDGTYPVAETMRAMAELIDAGHIRGIGVSNFSVAEMEEAADALGEHRLVCNQVLYHLEQRSIEVEVLPYCRDNDIAVVGYSPFGSGSWVTTGSAGARVLDEVAQTVGRTPRQVALRFLTRMDPLFTIPKAEKVSHVEENAGGAGWDLPSDCLAMLEEAFPVPKHVDGVPVL